MGCPVGSVLVGSAKDMQVARETRKLLGGWMRQSGILASCMLVAMEDWEERLTLDNDNCQFIASELNDPASGTYCDLSTVQTNMVHFFLDKKVTRNTKKRKGLDPASLCKIIREKYNILMLPSFANDCIRIVTHRDVDRAALELTNECIKAELKPYL